MILGKYLNTAALAVATAFLVGCQEPRSPIPDSPPQRYKQGIEHTIYFDTARADLDPADRKEIDEFVQQQGRGPAIIEGHCDTRGSDEYNYELGSARAKSVMEHLNALGITDLTTISYGESAPKEKGEEESVHRQNRRATIISGSNIVWAGLDAAPAEAYLIDGSGSMRATLDGIVLHEEPLPGKIVRNDSRWSMVAAYPFPKEADVYVFTARPGLPSLVPLSDRKAYFPQGETPLWNSIEEMARAGKYSSITVLTDGDNNVCCTSKDDVIEAAISTGTAISTIGIGVLSKETKADLAEVAKRTGGKSYIQETARISRPGLRLEPWTER